MKTRGGRPSHVLLLALGIAAVLSGSAGFARMMGWSLMSTGDYGDMLTPDRTAVARTPGETRAAPRCAECGVIVSVREIERHDEDPGPAAAGGVMAGNRDGTRARPSGRSEITVRMADGSSRVIEAGNPARWRAGERLIVIGDAEQSSR